MDKRVDELKGGLKEGAGRLTDNERLEAEGRGEREIAKAKRNIEGAGEQVKGTIEQTVGRLTGDEETRAKGTADRAEGNIDRTG
jgi:uncharacterized protein YjbJ (UPF0337 family)